MRVQRLRSSKEWVRDLTGTSAAQAAAVTELRALLVRAALFTFGHVQSELPVGSASQVERLADACAQEALRAICEGLPRFRAESKFTTWANKFAVNFALTAARRERWQAVPLERMLEAGVAGGQANSERAPSPPELDVQNAEIWSQLQQAMDQALSPRQRQVINALIFQEVPMDELVRHLGSDRNTVYTLVHEARRKLKARLEARGCHIGDILAVLGEPG
jgi:RNA polymerase sigma-70 factor (ECF subfamily)